MPDLNELLRWSIENSERPPTASGGGAASNDGQQLALRFNPATTPSSGSSALHPSDPQYRPPNVDVSDDAAASSTAVAPTENRREDLTTEMLDLIMGKSDSIIMKEKMDFAIDRTKTTDERVQALDDFEMLIELIDNANNMAILKLWDPILALLQDDSPLIVAHACWIIGTAVQNNLKAQAALYIFDALPAILSVIESSQPVSARAKATYALSSALKHWPLASDALAQNGSRGYKVLKAGVRDAAPVIRRKMAFLIGTLTMQSGEKYEGEIPNEVRGLVEEKMKDGTKSELLVDALRREGVYESLAAGLAEGREEVDVEYEENAVRALSKAAEKGGLSDELRSRVTQVWKGWTEEQREERGLNGEDGADISRALA